MKATIWKPLLAVTMAFMGCVLGGQVPAAEQPPSAVRTEGGGEADEGLKQARLAVRESEAPAFHLAQESREKYLQLAEQLARRVGAHYQVLFEALDDPKLHPDTRYLAATALGYFREQRREVVPRLLAMLERSRLRGYAGEPLYMLDVVPELAAVASDRRAARDARLEALHRLRLLARLAEGAIPQVLVTLSDEDLAVRRAGLLAAFSMRAASKDILDQGGKLLSDPDARVRAALVRHFDDRRDAVLPPELASKHIIEAIEDQQVRNREELLWSLPLLHYVDVLPALRKSFASKDAAIRAVAVGVAKRLSYLDPEKVSPIVAAALDDPDPVVRVRAFDVVYGRNGERIPKLNLTVSNLKLVEFLNDRTGIQILVGEDRVWHYPVHEVATQELMRRGLAAKEIVPQLRALLARQDRTEAAGIQAARLLGSLLPNEESLRLYDAQEPHVLLAVIQGESGWRDLDGLRLEAMFRLLRHQDHAVARAAAKALQRGWQPAAERYWKIVQDANEAPFVRSLAFDALSSGGRACSSKELLQDYTVVGEEYGEPLPLAARALEAYRTLDKQELLRLIRSAADDRRAPMRRAAAKRLPEARCYGQVDEVQALLLKLLKDPAPGVREAAVTALTYIDPTRTPELATPAAQLARSDPSAAVRRAAVQFLSYMRKNLRHLAPKETLNAWTGALIGALRDADAAVRLEALTAFNDEIGTPAPEVEKALKERLDDADSNVAKWARVDLVRYRLIEEVDEPVPDWPSLSPWQAPTW